MTSHRAGNGANFAQVETPTGVEEIGLSVATNPPSPVLNHMSSTRKQQSEGKEHRQEQTSISAIFGVISSEKDSRRPALSLQIDETTEEEKACERDAEQTPRSAAVTLQVFIASLLLQTKHY